MATEVKTYADAVRPGRSPPPELTPEISSYKGEIAIRFSKEQIELVAAPFQYALIGKFSQGKPNLDAIKRFLEVQNYAEQYTVGVLDSKHILINFTGEKDFIRLYSRSQWFVTSKPMRILKWTPEFHVDVESSIVPTWILLPKLPAHLMKVEALKGIVSSFGKLLRADASTTSLKRPSTAIIQVEIDLLKAFPRRIWIQQGDSSGFWQFVELEADLPSYCVYCCHIGHVEETCRIKNPQQALYADYQNQEAGHNARKTRTSGPPAQIWRQKQPSSSNSEQHQQTVNESSQLEGDRTLGELQNQLSHYTQHFNPLSNSPPHVELEGVATTSVSSTLDVHQMVAKRNKEVDLATFTNATECDNVATTAAFEKVDLASSLVTKAAGHENYAPVKPQAAPGPMVAKKGTQLKGMEHAHEVKKVEGIKAAAEKSDQAHKGLASCDQNNFENSGSKALTTRIDGGSQKLDVAANQGPKAVPTITEGSATVKEGVLIATPICSVNQAIEYSEGCQISNPFEILSMPSTEKALKPLGIHSQASIQEELRFMSLDPKVWRGAFRMRFLKKSLLRLRKLLELGRKNRYLIFSFVGFFCLFMFSFVLLKSSKLGL